MSQPGSIMSKFLNLVWPELSGLAQKIISTWAGPNSHIYIYRLTFYIKGPNNKLVFKNTPYSILTYLGFNASVIFNENVSFFLLNEKKIIFKMKKFILLCLLFAHSLADVSNRRFKNSNLTIHNKSKNHKY